MSQPFSRSAIGIIIGVAAASLIAAVVLTVWGDELTPPPSAGADGYSVSAVGHRALVELLEELDIPVVVSRHDSAAKAAGGLLIIAEPLVAEGDEAAADKLHELIEGADRVLVVLPKWYGHPDPETRVWIEEADPVPVDEVKRVASLLSTEDEIAVEVVRLGRPADWTIDWTVDVAEAPTPVIREPQVLTGEVGEGRVWSEQGTLLSEQSPELWILSDPDVLNNHGLRERDNARFAVALIDKLREGGPVVIDETIHGFASEPSLVKALFEFPLVLATLQVILCALLLVWAAATRFGPARAAPPPIAPGKDFLIRNTAALLRYGGHDADALQRYLVSAVQQVRHVLHAPAELPPAALTAWLERVRQARGGRVVLPDLERDVHEVTVAPRGQADRIVELADRIHRWRTEMTHGSAHHS